MLAKTYKDRSYNVAGLSCFTFLKVVYYYMNAYEYFQTKEFKSLTLRKRIWIRIQVAFFDLISMH